MVRNWLEVSATSGERTWLLSNDVYFCGVEATPVCSGLCTLGTEQKTKDFMDFGNRNDIGLEVGKDAYLEADVLSICLIKSYRQHSLNFRNMVMPRVGTRF